MAVPENGLALFASNHDSIWIQNENGDVDASTSFLPLDESTCAFLFAFSGKKYDIVIADGSQDPTIIATIMEKTPENVRFLITTMTSLIRQYDSKAADDILNFWFEKTPSDDAEKDRSKPFIDWTDTNKKEEND